MDTRRLRRPFLILVLAGMLAPLMCVSFAGSSGVSAALSSSPSSAPAPAPALPSAPAEAQGIPPAPSRWVTDEAGFLSRPTVDSLDARLGGYERQTGHQIFVWIGRTIGTDQVLEEWAARTFEAWKVGRKGIDDGLVLFILADDRKIKIEVGYGLEDKVPDIYAYRVISNILAPGISAGRQDEAVEAAVTALIGYISGNENAAGERPAAPRVRSTVKSVFTGIIVLVVIILFITNPSLAFWLLLNILGGGRGGGGGWGGGGGGGGFGGGGGGRSGGGGASGGW